MRIAVFILPFVAAVALAATPLDDNDFAAYPLSPSLDQVFSSEANSASADVELSPPGQWFRIEKVRFTGGLREAGLESRDLVVSWRDNRDALGGLAGLTITRDFFPEAQAEFEQGGSKRWLLLSLPEVQTLRSKASMELTLFVQRIGFVKGEPQVYLRMLGDAEQVRVALENAKRRKPRVQPQYLPVTPRPPPPPISWRLARYTQGEAQVWYEGKKTIYSLRAGSPKSPLGLFKGFVGSERMLVLEFCADEGNCLVLDNIRFNDEGTSTEPVVNLRVDGRAISASRNCRVKIAKADVNEVRGRCLCEPLPGEAPLERVEFTAAP